MPRGSPDQLSDPEPASASCASCASSPLLELPTELLVMILEYLPLRDLTKICLVCYQLNGIVNSEHFTSLWTKASLEQLWPSQNSTHIIQKAAKRGNAEALIKLSVAYLYSEGVPEGDGKGTIASSNGVTASRLLSQAERRIANQEPFSWVLIRPPWTSTGLCCKACVCEHMKLHHDEEKPSSAIPYCIGKVLSFLEPPQNDDAVVWFRKAADLGCPYATYELWQLDAGDKRWTTVEEIQLVRRLRALASTNIWPARLDLCLAYINHQYGGINKDQATQFVKHVFDQAKPAYTNKLFTIQKKLNYTMRYILVDWLIEVSEMKEFSTLVLHVAVDCVDRYLQLRPISRNWLQLVGITALLLAARWIGSTIITVREAAWLTENTYRYEDVVRTVGEMLSVFNGCIRLPCTADYLDMMLKICKAGDKLRHMCQYISESALLYTELRIISPSVLAAAVVLLSNVLVYQEAVWTQSLVNFTGLHMDQLAPYCVNIYSYWFSSDQYSAVSKIGTLSLDLVKEHLDYQSLQALSSLTSQGSQESMILSDWTESEDMEASQLQKDRSSLSEEEQVTISLEASQRIACKETYRAPPDQEFMDMSIHLQKPTVVKQKQIHNGDSSRQPLRQINNTFQGQGKSPGPSKISSSSSSREKRTRKPKIYN